MECISPRCSATETAPWSFYPGEPLDERQARVWLWTILALGILVRLLRYGLRMPLWYDEACLSANFLQRGYGDFAQPLDGGQACPILFLWVQLTFVRLFGFSEYALRLFPLLAGVGSLLLFRRLAGRFVRGAGLVLVVGMLAASLPAIRYSAEGKPYGTDLFISLALLTMTVEWMTRPERTGWLWALAALAPVAACLSFPAAFVGGGASLAIARTLWRGGHRGWTAWAAFNLLLVAGFLVVMTFARKNVDLLTNQNMQDYWKESFPPFDSIKALALWLLKAHSGDVLAHPFGGKNGASSLTLLLFVVGLVVLARRRPAVAVLLVTPFALTLLAAAMHRYPYGGHVRLAMHLAPMVCLAAGLGLAAIVGSYAVRRPGRVPTVLVAGSLVLLIVAEAARQMVRPGRAGSDQQSRAFAIWFWTAKSYDGVLVCAKTDLRLPFTSPIAREGEEAMYLCNQRIYSPRHAHGDPPPMDAVSAERPLRVAWFRVLRLKEDEAAVEDWLRSMSQSYRLSTRARYPLPVYQKHGLEEETCVEVFEFLPTRR